MTYVAVFDQKEPWRRRRPDTPAVARLREEGRDQ